MDLHIDLQSPLAFGKGLIRGSSSLLRNSVAGLFGAFSAMTGSLGRGFALLSGDESDNQSCVSGEWLCFALLLQCVPDSSP